MKLPYQLQRDEFRFIKLNHRKIPIEKDWNGENNYWYKDPIFQKWIEADNSYGIATGFGNLVVLDFDDKIFLKSKIKEIVPTFTVVSPSMKGAHFYYILSNGTINTYWRDENEVRVADVKCLSGQVVGPGSFHPKYPNGPRYEVRGRNEIATVPKEYIYSVIESTKKEKEKYVKHELKYRRTDNKYDYSLIKYTISMVLSEFGNITIPSHGYTNCPFHHSNSGKCLSYNDKEGWFHCFHCGESGNVIKLLMKIKRIPFIEAWKILTE